MQTQQMLSTHPSGSDLDMGALTECIDACFECAQSCTACADACLAEDMVADLRHCIRTDLDCADICTTTGRVLSRLTEPDWSLVRAQVEALAQAVRACGDECEEHASMHEHCRVCAESCRRCEESCEQVLQAISSVAQA